jgi:trehalose-phosphatase
MVMFCSLSTFLNLGRFLAALTNGQLPSMRWSSFVLPQHVFDAPKVEQRYRAAPTLFLGLDYDGTLVPIAQRPEEARPSAALLARLSQLAQTSAIDVAILSGRPLAALCTLLPVPGIAYVGTHGLEVRVATGEIRCLLSAGAFTTVMARLRRDAEAIVSDHPGFLLEDKKHALALHYRLARKADQERIVAQFLATVRAYQCKGVAVEVLHGKEVVEVRPVGVNKGKAVQLLLAHGNNAALPLYLGDDATDEDAFRVVNGRGGLSILVADPPRRTAARYYLRNPEEVFRFLTRLLSFRQQCKQTGRPATSV